MKVAVLTMFNGLDSTYSLVNVVREHLEIFLKNGIDVKVLVSEDCRNSERTGVYADSRIEWVKITNRLDGKRIRWYDYSVPEGEVHDTFNRESEEIAKGLIHALGDVDICIMHDILYQGWHLVHNAAVRIAQKALPRLKFVAFTHSQPAVHPEKADVPRSFRFMPMENTVYAYPTECGLEALASQYNVPIERCFALSNTFSPSEYLSKEANHVAQQIDLAKPEIVIVYPARMTFAKHFEKVTAFAGVLNRFADGVAVVFCDFPATDTSPDAYKRLIRRNGNRFGLPDEAVLFTSDIGYSNGFPRKAVLDLFSLSNLFVCPSYSESFGLTVLEAGFHKNFLVLNEGVPALKELGETLGAYFMRWDALGFGVKTVEHYHPSEEAYYAEQCEKIIEAIRANPSTQASRRIRQIFSADEVFKSQFLPLLNMLLEGKQ